MKNTWGIFMMYWFPNEGATGYIVRDLARGLVKKKQQVTIFTSRLHQRPLREANWDLQEMKKKAFLDEDGIEVLRVPVFAPPWLLQFSPNIYRLVSFFSYFISAFFTALLKRKKANYFVTTSPPFFGGLLASSLSILRKSRMYYQVQDLYPEVLLESKLLTNPKIISFFRYIEMSTLQRADKVFVISKAMQSHLSKRVKKKEKIIFIPNFMEKNEIYPSPKKNAFSRKYGVTESLNLIYSGNMLPCHGLEGFVLAAKYCKEKHSDLNLQWIFIGYGESFLTLKKQVQVFALGNFLFLPLQERKLVNQVYATADIGLVGLGAGFSKYILPSKIISLMAAGRPVLCLSPEKSPINTLLEESGGGVVAKTAEDLVQAIIRFHQNKEYSHRVGTNARSYFLKNYAKEAVLPTLLRELNVP